MQLSYPAYGVGQSRPETAVIDTTHSQFQHKKLKNNLPARRHPLTLRVGIKNCNGADRNLCCNLVAKHPRLYSLAAYQTLRQVPAALWVDGLYNSQLPVWVWNVLLHIPNGTKKIDAFGCAN